MTKFIKDILKIITTLFVIVVLCLILRIESNRKILDSSLFIFDSNELGLIIGDSHPMTSLNPRLISSFVNFSQAGENYFYTYYKLRHLLEKNPQIKTVVLGCSYHNFVLSQERSLKETTYTNKAFDTYYCMLDKGAKSVIRQVNENFLPDYLRYEYGVPFYLYRNNIAIRARALFNKRFTDADRSFFGGYFRGGNTVVNNQMIDSYLQDIYYPSIDKTGSYKSDICIEYLHKILGLCAEKRIHVLLYNAPLHPHLLKRIPEEVKSMFDSIIKDISWHYPDVEYVDFSSVKLIDSMFGDANHLNGTGSDIISRKLSLLFKDRNSKNTTHGRYGL